MNNPYQSPNAMSDGSSAATYVGSGDVSPTEPLQRASGWIKLCGIGGIVFAALMLLFALAMMFGGSVLSSFLNNGFSSGSGGASVMFIIMGVIYLGIGGFYLWLSILVLQAGIKYATNDVRAHYEASNKLRILFMVFGVLTILSLVLMAFYFLAALAALVSM